MKRQLDNNLVAEHSASALWTLQIVHATHIEPRQDQRFMVTNNFYTRHCLDPESSLLHPWIYWSVPPKRGTFWGNRSIDSRIEKWAFWVQFVSKILILQSVEKWSKPLRSCKIDCMDLGICGWYSIASASRNGREVLNMSLLGWG